MKLCKLSSWVVTSGVLAAQVYTHLSECNEYAGDVLTRRTSRMALFYFGPAVAVSASIWCVVSEHAVRMSISQLTVGAISRLRQLGLVTHANDTFVFVVPSGHSFILRSCTGAAEVKPHV